MMHDLAFDLVELVPCPEPARDGPGAALREVAFREDAWLPGDIDGLRQRFAADEDLQEIADALDRTLAAVRTKVRDLGLRRNSSRPWPGMDDAYLAEHYGREATSTIAASRPMIRLVWPPYRIRDSRSRPFGSVPSRWPADSGGREVSRKTPRTGSGSGRTRARTSPPRPAPMC